MMTKILNFGSLNYDYVYTVHHIVQGGETIASAGMETYCGGKGLNQSIALARAGASVFHAGQVGEEGDQMIELCRESGVDVRYIRKIAGKSGHTIIQVDRNAQNCIILFGGSNRKMTHAFIDEVLQGFEAGDYLLLQNEINEIPYIIDQAYQKGMKIVMNPSPYDEHVEECDLSKMEILMINEVEGEQITGKKDASEILTTLVNQYPDMKILLTLGSKGAIYCIKGQQFIQTAMKVDAVDTTAAGDTFTGYFLDSVLRGLSVEKALQRATAASALAVTRPGAAASIPMNAEVEEML
ncbi:MAG: ribokinase [bacterium]|nr:ribokinase [bacterium]